MSKRRQPSTPERDAIERPAPIRTRWKVVISLAILWHLWAVNAEPIRFQTRGPFRPSPAADALYRPVGPYAEWMYLTHGYAFFAPDPGPNHLIEATVAGGETRRYPDLQLDRPRLFYHRHFMLSEFLNNLYRGELPPNLANDPEARAAHAADEKLYRQVKESMRHHLSQRANGATVELRRIEHRMPGLPEFLVDRVKLNDPRLYQELPESTVAPLSPPRLIPYGGYP